MDEILASIRRIIETGDEKSTGANREAAVGAARQIPAFLAGASFQEPLSVSVQPDANGAPAPLRFPSPPEPVHVAAQGHLTDDDHLTAELETELAATWERIETRYEAAQADAPVERPQDERFSDPGLRSMSQDVDPHPFTAPAAAGQPNAGAPNAHASANYEAPMERNAFEPANTDARRADEGAGASSRFGDTPPPLVSPTTGQLVGASFNELAEAIRQGELRSLEAMAQEMLQPMLRDWLDDNLPKMVERLIREEIERLARGGIKR
ncbi:DUF2497 domain-containing protein [Aureimonas sp. Leaf324]|uniref:PopZ family protein n=1 Tax=Aureimonas sp. Leaf324 TaxID=1736336 RepID=UPI0006F78F39|nr:DUF2497 domain-containing protein [Aureimonas sp. Leaf324]KQQ91184.1 hypothetical protein ASF65_01270 [Aureimonas sp. Leaf324]